MVSRIASTERSNSSRALSTGAALARYSARITSASAAGRVAAIRSMRPLALRAARSFSARSGGHCRVAARAACPCLSQRRDDRRLDVLHWQARKAYADRRLHNSADARRALFEHLQQCPNAEYATANVARSDQTAFTGGVASLSKWMMYLFVPSSGVPVLSARLSG